MTPDLRIATNDDIEFLAHVVLLTNQERYVRRDGWDREAFHRGLVADAADQVAGGPENSTTYVVAIGDHRVGRLRVVRTDTCLEIAGLQIHPAWQGRGIGTAVVRGLLGEAVRSGRPVVLDVESDNPGARRLYERLGFVDTGRVQEDRARMIHPGRSPGPRPRPD